MPKPAPIAATATILLHALLIAAVVAGLNADPEPDTRSEPLKVQLLPPEPPPAPVVLPTPQPPAPTPAPVKKERPAPKPAAEPRPAPNVAAPSPAPSQTAPQDTKPAPVAGPPAPASAAPPAPPAPSAPVRTSASEASYAATNRTPPYPRISLSNGDEGTVVLRVLVTAEGTAGAVEIKTSSGHSLLDESARKTVLGWRFKPATVDGKPVAEWYQVPIPFKLQNN